MSKKGEFFDKRHNIIYRWGGLLGFIIMAILWYNTSRYNGYSSVLSIFGVILVIFVIGGGFSFFFKHKK